MYEKPSCHVSGMYQYVPVHNKNSCTGMYWHVPVHTGTYRYVRFCLILSRCIGFQMDSEVTVNSSAAAASRTREKVPFFIRCILLHIV